MIVNGLKYGVTYTIKAGGTFTNGSDIGPRLSHGIINLLYPSEKLSLGSGQQTGNCIHIFMHTSRFVKTHSSESFGQGKYNTII